MIFKLPIIILCIADVAGFLNNNKRRNESIASRAENIHVIFHYR